MIRNFLYAMFAVALVAGIAGCDDDDDTTVDTTEHDNLVLFMPDWGNPPLSFSLSDHDITSGQPWSGVSSSMDGGTMTLNARAGRHGSGGCASWFHNHASKATCCNWPSGCDDWPSDLNFAFTGTITIEGNNYSITIGQGSNGVHNNWWVGGPNWTSWSSPFGDAVVTPDNKYYFEAADDTFNQFYIRKKP